MLNPTNDGFVQMIFLFQRGDFQVPAVSFGGVARTWAVEHIGKMISEFLPIAIGYTPWEEAPQNPWHVLPFFNEPFHALRIESICESRTYKPFLSLWYVKSEQQRSILGVRNKESPGSFSTPIRIEFTLLKTSWKYVDISHIPNGSIGSTLGFFMPSSNWSWQKIPHQMDRLEILFMNIRKFQSSCYCS